MQSKFLLNSHMKIHSVATDCEGKELLFVLEIVFDQSSTKLRHKLSRWCRWAETLVAEKHQWFIPQSTKSWNQEATALNTKSAAESALVVRYTICSSYLSYCIFYIRFNFVGWYVRLWARIWKLYQLNELVAVFVLLRRMNTMQREKV